MNQNEQALKKALDAINEAKNKVNAQRNEEDRRYIVANIGKDLISILTPLLQKIADNSMLNREDLKSVISQITVDSPIVSVSPPEVRVEAPKIPAIEIPKIEFPKAELIKAMKEAIKGIKIPAPDVKVPPMPKEMAVKQMEELITEVKKIADAKMTVELSDKYDRDNPLPVILTDEDGRFYKAITEVIQSSTGGGGVGIGSLTQHNGRLQIDVTPGTYKLAGNTVHIRRYYTAAGATNDGIIWSPAAGRRWYLTDIFVGVSADATVTLEDDLAAGDDVVWRHEIAANSGWSHSFTTPLYSGEDGADLIITNSAGNIYVTCSGYEA